MKVEYSSNNSGGSWWLKDADWYALERVGWKVDWYETSEHRYQDYSKYGGKKREDTYPNGRFLGALASSASREGLSLRDAIEEWERVTGQYSSALGCSCCGTPHSFSFEGDNGEYDYYSPEFPMYGEPY
jgi:hypothetical protein